MEKIDDDNGTVLQCIFKTPGTPGLTFDRCHLEMYFSNVLFT